jgi:GNAT superfamily N-acetyltransferase
MSPGGGAAAPAGTPAPPDPLLLQLEGRLPPECLRGLRSLPPEQLAAVLPALLQAVEVQIEPLTPSAAAAAALSSTPERFGFLPRDVAAELSPSSAALWNQGQGPVALGAFSSAGESGRRQLAGFVVARVEVLSPCAAAAEALAATAPARAAPLLRPALRAALGQPEPAAVASVALLGVDFAFRRQGVGAALLGAVEAVVAATAGAAAAAQAAGGGGGGGGSRAAGGAVVLLAPEPLQEEEEGGGAARFYAGRGYGRAGDAALEVALGDEGEEGEEEPEEAAAAATAAAGEQRARRPERRRRFGLWTKQVAAEDAGAGTPSPVPSKRRRAAKRAGGGGKGFAASAIAMPATATRTSGGAGPGGAAWARASLSAPAATTTAPARSGLLLPPPRFRCLAARALSPANVTAAGSPRGIFGRGARGV